MTSLTTYLASTSPSLIALIATLTVIVVGLALFLISGGSRNDPRCPNCDHPLSVAPVEAHYRVICRACGFKERRARQRRAP